MSGFVLIIAETFIIAPVFVPSDTGFVLNKWFFFHIRLDIFLV